jgi:hypothetical protein
MGEPYHIIAALQSITGLVSYKNTHNSRDRVYLCKEHNPTTNSPIFGFRCYKYNSLDQALQETSQKKYQHTRHAIITVCRWVPPYFDKYILDRKLKRVFWLGKHTIFFPNGTTK